MIRETMDLGFEKNIKNIFSLSPDIEKFGGVQKFVLLKHQGKHYLGSLPEASHSSILETMTGGRTEGIEVLGGGAFTFFNNEIVIDSNFKSSKLGPIQIKDSELIEVIETVVGSKYRVTVSG